jgi:hypothetical protein
MQIKEIKVQLKLIFKFLIIFNDKINFSHLEVKFK